MAPMKSQDSEMRELAVPPKAGTAVRSIKRRRRRTAVASRISLMHRSRRNRRHRTPEVEGTDRGQSTLFPECRPARFWAEQRRRPVVLGERKRFPLLSPGARARGFGTDARCGRSCAGATREDAGRIVAQAAHQSRCTCRPTCRAKRSSSMSRTKRARAAVV
jgi:hypothetical protein